MLSLTDYESLLTAKGLIDCPTASNKSLFLPVFFDKVENLRCENTIGVVPSLTNHQNDTDIGDFRFVKLYHSFVGLNIFRKQYAESSYRKNNFY